MEADRVDVKRVAPEVDARDAALAAISSAAATKLRRLKAAEQASVDLVAALRVGERAGLSDERMAQAVQVAIPPGTTVSKRPVSMSNMAVRRALGKASPK